MPTPTTVCTGTPNQPLPRASPTTPPSEWPTTAVRSSVPMRSAIAAASEPKEYRASGADPPWPGRSGASGRASALQQRGPALPHLRVCSKAVQQDQQWLSAAAIENVKSIAHGGSLSHGLSSRMSAGKSCERISGLLRIRGVPMSDGERLKRHRVPRHRHLRVGTGSSSASSLLRGTRAAAGVRHHRAVHSASGDPRAVAGTGSDGCSRLDADPDVTSDASLGVGVANGIDTRTDAGASSGVGTGAGGGSKGGSGERVRRPTRHRATPWTVAHRAAAAVGAASVAAVAVITVVLTSGGPAVDTATGGGKWTPAPASSPLPAVPSAQQLFVPLPTASPTMAAGARGSGGRAGGNSGRDRQHPTPKRSAKPRPDPTPKPRPSRSRPMPLTTVMVDPGSPPSRSLPGRPTSTGTHQH
jgi:hypothetical protein